MFRHYQLYDTFIKAAFHYISTKFNADQLIQIISILIQL